MDKSIQKILDVLNKVKNKKVVVIGDILLDEYAYGMFDKVSTGIQITIIEKERTEYRLGGAANIAANIAGLCDNSILIGRCGNDDAGNMVKVICEDCGVNLINYTCKKTTVKQRIYIDNQQVSRLDTNCHVKSIFDELDSIFKHLDAEVIILADYLYGVITQKVVDKLINYCREKDILLLMTSRDLNKFCLSSDCVIVVNQKEWNMWNNSDSNKEAFITMGEKGIRYIYEGNKLEKKAEKSIRSTYLGLEIQYWQ